ncbi:MAG: exodeoxyribonuclease VII large subunit [Firmicutes bacterium]|nr:exodeoxyribonuclease VII large subunit [Bacillota bacterium]HQD40152.1 exodeoxyribonuclease VII large subunit [Bacillota bacterium]
MQGIEMISVTVSELTAKIKARLESDLLLQDVLVRGEISNYKRHSSGHLYFTMKDEEASLRCVMFRSYAARLPFEPQDGEEVLALGRIGVYERGGQYQLYVHELVPLGQGALALAFEQLKNKLSKEGLFDQERKKALPLFPKRIGIVSSPTGAAIRDLLSVLKRRWPSIEVVLSPALVQGDAAAASIVRALKLLEDAGNVDLIIVARGGGSLEDLWPFNEESVARAIYECPLPVISAVGHEVDFTIADFVADLRAPTPSAAAEMAVQELGQILAQLRDYHSRLCYGLLGVVRFAKKKLQAIAKSRIFQRKEELFAEKQQRLDELGQALEQAMARRLREAKESLRFYASSLQQLSPLATLERGYSICLREGKAVISSRDLAVEDEVELVFHQGRANCVVTELINDIDKDTI